MQSMQSNLRRRLSIKARSFAASTPGTTDGFPELYVCNLPREATEKSVREAFSKVVDIKSLRVPFSRTTGRCAGYAFLAVDAADAERVRKEMHGFIFGSHSIEVEMAKTSRDVASVAVFQAEKERVRAQRNFDKLLAKAEDEVEVVKLPELFVRNLPVDFSAADVKLAFKDACEVSDVRMSVDRRTGESKGYAFLVLKADVDVESVISKMEGRVLKNAGYGNEAKGLSVQVPEARVERQGMQQPKTRKQLSEHKTRRQATFLQNKHLVQCNTASEILAAFQVGGAKYNVVNLATSLHRVGVLHKSVEAHSGGALQRLVEKSAESISNDSIAWEARHLANAVWGTAKVVVPRASLLALFGAVSAVAPSKMETFNAQDVANTAWAYSKAGVSEPRVFEALAKVAPGKLLDFTPQNLANTVWAFATQSLAAPKLFEAIASESWEKIDDFKAQELANLAWAFTTASAADEDLFQAVAHASETRLKEFKPQELANLSWAFAKGSMAAPALFHALAAECVSQMAEFPLQSLATVSWAFAKAGVEAPLLFRAVATHVENKAPECTAQELSTFVWAFAKAGEEAPALFRAAKVQIFDKVHSFNAQDLEDVAWAYSKEAGDSTDADKHGELLEAVATEATKSISTFPPSALANMVWIYAKSRAPELFKAVEAEASRKMSDFSAHSLAKLAWAYSTAGIAAPSLFLSIAEAALLKLGQFSAKDVATLALAFAKADVASPSLFDALASSSRSKMENFDAQSLTFLAWAFSKAEANPGLFDSIAEEAVLKIKTFDARNLSNLARAFAKAGVAAPALYEAIANEAETKVTAFSEKDLGVLAFAFRYSFARVQAPLLFQAAAVFETEYRQGREASSDDFDGQGTAEPSAAEYEADVASYDDAAGLEFSTSRGESRASFEATQRWQPDSSRLHPDLDSKRVDPKRRPAERRSEMRPAVRNIGDGNWQ